MPSEPDEIAPDIKVFVDALNEHDVEYVMVGGIAALLYGSERATHDLDVLARGSLDNLDRLATALSVLGAGDNLDSADLRGTSTRWSTSAGRVDVLLAARGLDGKLSISYRDVADRHIDVIHDGTSIPVVALDDLIAMKTAVGRPHDLETVKELAELHGRPPEDIAQIFDQWDTLERGPQDPPSPGIER